MQLVARVWRDDETRLLEVVRAAGDGGVHFVCAARPDAVAAAALLARAIGRAKHRVAGWTALGCGEALDGEHCRAWLAGAPALIVVGLDARAAHKLRKPVLALDGGDDGEPLPARAHQLGSSLAQLGDAAWCAAVALGVDGAPHPLVERARARHGREDLVAVGELLEAAARGPEPASHSLMAAEMLAAAPDPRRFLRSVPAELLRRAQAAVRTELTRAAALRPRAGFGVLVVEYASPCRIEDLVAARWRGLRPGTAVLVANHGLVAGDVAVTTRAAAPEALERLQQFIGSDDPALISREVWEALLGRLGVVPAPVERSADAVFALPN